MAAAWPCNGLLLRNGSSSSARRWRTEIQPRIREFIRTIEYERGAIPTGRTARRMHHPAVAVSPV